MGSKQINAKPMHRQEYNDFRGWVLPSDEDGTDEGYLVEYVDGGKANTEEYSGYVSWSPKEVFERAYRPDGKLTFGDAIELLKSGNKVSRSGWNGKGMYLYLVPDLLVGQYGAHIVMKTADDKLIPWLASQTDMLANDWGVVA